MTDQIICDYDPAWPSQFDAERKKVASLLGELAGEIEHIGSTSVPGLAGKPLIDIVVATPAANVERCVSRLAALGYRRDPTGDFAGRVFLRRLGDEGAPTHHLSLTEFDSAYWRDQIAFRDALRSDPSLAAAYASLKRALAGEHGQTFAYTRAKTDFVRDALETVGHRAQSGWAAESRGDVAQ